MTGLVFFRVKCSGFVWFHVVAGIRIKRRKKSFLFTLSGFATFF